MAPHVPRTAERDGRQGVPLLVVGPVSAEAEPVPQASRPELEPRAALDVPGHQADAHVLQGRERVEQLDHARDDLDGPVLQPLLEVPQVTRPQLDHAPVDVRAEQPRPVHQLPRDLRVGLAREAHPGRVAGRPERLDQGHLERVLRRATPDQRPVDVEEDQAADRRRRAAHAHRSPGTRVGSRLPPLLTTAAANPSTSARPDSSAAVVAAPLYSTTSFWPLNRIRVAARISSSVTVNTSSHSSRACSNVSWPVTIGARPSAMVSMCSRRIGFPASSAARIDAAPSGSTPTTRACGSMRFTAAATPLASPPPPMGTSTTSTS